MHLRRVLRWQQMAVLGIVVMFATATFQDQAIARGNKSAKSEKHKRPIHGPNYRPPYADIVIDDKSGQVLHETNADEPRHPASLTKIMTLYMLFEQIEAGRLKLDSRLDVSKHAAIQNPTKLGLKAGSTITVEEAIKGMVTRSANDAAVVVAEAVGGTEQEFGRLMTTRARMLGMRSTTYVNASGLPDLEQITTARDQAVLGHAIQHRFPVYYQYFAIPSFRYRNAEIRNHNALLGNVKGVDGIKTGYTEASGYNLVTSCRRDDKHIVAVVLGGKSNSARDARMRELIEQHLPQAAVQRTAPTVIELGGEENSASVPAAPEVASSRAVPLPAPKPDTLKASSEAQGEELSAKAQATDEKAQASDEKPAPSRKAHARGSKRQSSRPRDNGMQGAATPGYTFGLFAPAPTAAPYYRSAH